MSPNDDRRGVVIGLQAALMTMTAASISLRIFTRLHVLMRIGKDDVLILIATGFAMLTSIAAILATKYGLGLHIEQQTQEMVKPYVELNLLGSCSYSACAMFIKLSFLFLYLRLSPDRLFRTLVYILIFLSTAFGISSISVVALQCIPISLLWNPNQPDGHCINVIAFYYANAAINITTDLAIYILPIKLLWLLQLPQRQRVGLVCLFGLGILVVAASLTRLVTLRSLIHSTDGTWSLVAPYNWSTIEIHVGIFITCGPAFKAFIRCYVPRILGSSSSTYRPSTNPPYSQRDRHRGPRSGSYPLSPVSRNSETKTTITASIRTKRLETESEENIILPYHGIVRETSVKVDVDHGEGTVDGVELGIAR